MTRGGVPESLIALSLGVMLLPSSLGVWSGADDGGVLLSESVPNVPRRGFIITIGESGASGMEGRARACEGAGVEER